MTTALDDAVKEAVIHQPKLCVSSGVIKLHLFTDALSLLPVYTRGRMVPVKGYLQRCFVSLSSLLRDGNCVLELAAFHNYKGNRYQMFFQFIVVQVAFL